MISNKIVSEARYALRCVHCVSKGTPVQIGISKFVLDDMVAMGLVQRLGAYGHKRYILTPMGNLWLQENGGPFPYEEKLRTC